MKSVIKSMAKGLAVVLVLCIIFTTIIWNSRQSISANDAFDGIKDILNSNNEDNPFRIIELVPDEDMAELGYLVGGQEPVQWLNDLANISGPDSRKHYISDLKKKLKAIIASDVSKPITYTEYEEAYAVADTTDWNILNLSKEETIESGKSGYRMDDVGAGNGNYKEEFKYTVNTEGKGEFNQNIDYYIYGSGYYGVRFAPVTTTINEAGEVVTGANKVYEAISSTALVKEEKFTEIAQNRPNAYLYRVSRADISAPYECVVDDNGKPMKIGVVSFDDLDQSNYIYYVVEFAYVAKEDMVYSKTYYEPVSEEFYADPTKGEYGAHLLEEAYIEAKDDEGKNIGHFDRSPDAAYIYVGEGAGNLILVKDKDGDLLYPVIVDKLYYKGGFENNEWLRNGVFNQGRYFDNNSELKMYFDIETLVPSVFNDIELSSRDLLYISSLSSINGQHDNFSKDNDISWGKVVSVINTVKEQKFPVIVDSSIVAPALGNLVNGTNMQKLVALLGSTNFFELEIGQESENDAEFWKKVHLSQDEDRHFVNRNIYVFPYNLYNDSDPQMPFVFRNFTTNFIGNTSDTVKFENEAKSVGFGEIATYINEQNLNRKTENEALGENKYEYFDLAISKAIAIEYIISAINVPVVEKNDSFKVLDIEPCYVDDRTADAISGETIKKWFTDKKYEVKDVKVTHVSMAEFIGKIDDLTAYDMIYFGLSRNKFHLDQGGNTLYNDSRMNGLIYSNVGDICVVSPDHSGLLNTDYYYNGIGQRVGIKGIDDNARVANQATYPYANNTYRYSGNDITSEKYKHIVEYVKTGSPVVVDDGFFDIVGNNYNINEYYIDNSSNIFRLMKEIISKDNVMVRSQAISKINVLYDYIQLGKPQISLVEQPKVQGTEYVKLSTNKMNFNFSLSNQGAADSNAIFDVKLYLDVNADGKFSNVQEVISANDVKLFENGKYMAPVATKDDTGNTSYHYELRAGMKHNYELVYDLPENYIGIIPWKLKVSQVDNEYRYDFKEGFVYRENIGPAQKINILQINTASYRYSTFNMEEDLNNPNSLFNRLLKQVGEYDIKITTISSDVLGWQYQPGYFDQYDMLIIGFADMVDIPDINGTVKGIKDYINEGKPVLFTHDTTSFVNSSVNTDQWGYFFNSEIRNLVGLDRYGILSSDALKEGLNLVKGDWWTGNLYNQAVEYAKENHTDLAYEPRSNRNVITKQNQGMTYGDLVRHAKYAGLDYNTYFNWKGTCTVSYPNGEIVYQTTRVSQVNKGQITTYPFLIPEDFSVSDTHSQYYQLNLNEDADADGESDIVVWYTLEGGGRLNNSLYSASPRDIRDNYYIFTKGNVTYSGVGHSSIRDNENELKLYINTMIAAYSSGVHAPDITIREKEDTDSAEVGTIYVSFDDEIEKGVVSPADTSVEQEVSGNERATESVYFTVEDTNIVKNLKRKEIHVDFGIPENITEQEYQNNKDKYIQIFSSDGTATYLRKVDIDVYLKSGDQTKVYLSSGVTYRAEIPLDLLGKKDNFVEIYAVAYTKIVKYTSDGKSEAKPVYTPQAYDTLRIQRLGLVNLD